MNTVATAEVKAISTSPSPLVLMVKRCDVKRLIETHATQTLQETAYMLGFSEPTSFYRYFKRVTGMTAKEYRESTTASKNL